MIVASVKIKGFNPDKLMREIKKDVERDLRKSPEKVLDSHVGETVESNCSKCGKTFIEILSHGKARCTKCGTITKVNLNVKFT